jgi:hypothetical protein
LAVGAVSASPRVAAAFFSVATAAARRCRRRQSPAATGFPRLGKTRGNQLARGGNELWRPIGGEWRTQKSARRRPSFWRREKIRVGFGDLLEGVFFFFFVSP